MANPPNTDALINSARCIDKCIPDGEKLGVLISVLYQLLQQITVLVASSNLTGNGSPAGVVNASVAGQMYFDISNPAAVNSWVATAVGSGGWYEIAGV